MYKIKEYQSKKNKVSRFRIMRSIFSSLLMTSAVVAAFVFIVPKSAEGKIEMLKAFDDTIVYEVHVSDSDDSIISGTLQIELVSQFTKQDKTIELGKNLGYFYNLKTNTEYTLKVLADKGYGLEVLDSNTVRTSIVTGGAITEIDLLSDSDAQLLTYNVGYLVKEQTPEYKQINLLYAYKFPEDEFFQNYNSVIVDKNNTEVQISEIYNYNVEVNLILQGVTFDDELVELDNRTFSTPYKLFGYLDLQQVTNNLASFNVWLENDLSIDAKYKIELYKNDRLMRQQAIEFNEDQDNNYNEHSSNLIVFHNLYRNSDYKALLVAEYINPDTGVSEEQTIYTIDFTTLDYFNDNITINEYETYYEVNITLSENDNIFDQGFYKIYDKSNESDFDIGNAYFNYQYINGEKQISFNIDKPGILDYRIEIGVSSSSNYFYYKILENIDSESEDLK